MAHKQIKTEHAGAKNGGGAWMTREETKQAAKGQRRREDEIESTLSTDEREDSWARANARDAVREEPW